MGFISGAFKKMGQFLGFMFRYLQFESTTCLDCTGLGDLQLFDVSESCPEGDRCHGAEALTAFLKGVARHLHEPCILTRNENLHSLDH